MKRDRQSRVSEWVSPLICSHSTYLYANQNQFYFPLEQTDDTFYVWVFNRLHSVCLFVYKLITILCKTYFNAEMITIIIRRTENESKEKPTPNVNKYWVHTITGSILVSWNLFWISVPSHYMMRRAEWGQWTMCKSKFTCSGTALNLDSYPRECWIITKIIIQLNFPFN